MGTTTTDLVLDLLKKPPSEARDALIRKARGGKYHCWMSPSDTPKVQAIIELSKAGFIHLADKVRNGEYDENPGET